jgi:hypothetical protein
MHYLPPQRHQGQLPQGISGRDKYITEGIAGNRLLEDTLAWFKSGDCVTRGNNSPESPASLLIS